MNKNIFFFFLFLLIISLLSACQVGDSASQPTLTSLEARGKQVFAQNCASCHATIPDTVIVGPSLAGIATRASSNVEGLDSRSYIEQSILEPGAFVNEGFQDLMPKGFAANLNNDDFEGLVAYLLTLK